MPSIRVHSNYGYFENKVVIESVTSNTGSFDTFSAYLSPAPTNTSYVNITNEAFNSTDLELTNLDGATEYILTVQIEKRPDACGITEAGSLFNTKSVAVCTGMFALIVSLSCIIHQNINKWPVTKQWYYSNYIIVHTWNIESKRLGKHQLWCQVQF